jgi:hypothetical protein
MKKNDLLFALLLLLLIASFFPFGFLESYQKDFLFNPKYWYLTSFLKFAVLATLGESLGLRISKGIYNFKGFGLLPRAIVWGLLGIGIKMAFVIFAAGTPALLMKLFHVESAMVAMKEYPDFFAAQQAGLGGIRLLDAFLISTFMNLIFAPVFMTFHKITDMHIISNGGTLSGFFSPIKFSEIFPKINWFVQWDFVFKRSIPFFWIPAHTITFLLPEAYQVIFAAFLGIILGVLLATASLKSSK